MYGIQAYENTQEKLDDARTLMASFAERTGLAPERPSPSRYLWTDAFAVCNFLALAQQRHRGAYIELAGRLIRQVHRTLGYHPVGDRRQGPISGLPPREADEQPTVGGLRSGAASDGQIDEGDGQYFHHETKWMHALNRMGTATGDATYHRWARELACTAHSAFAQEAAAGRMFWKMSVDLDRPLIASSPTPMARHDPLDALVTYCQLQLSASGGGPDLTGEIYDAAVLCEGASWATNDALGIGVLLIDASRVAQLVAFDASREIDAIDAIDLCDVIDALQPGPLLAHMLESARVGLSEFVHSEALAQPPEQRNAFRELGLAIGLAALPVVAKSRHLGRADPAFAIDRLARYVPLRAQIVSFWRDARRRREREAQRDLEDVMLATALLHNSFGLLDTTAMLASSHQRAAVGPD